MHRNTIIAICVAFCAVAIAAGWGVAGLSGSPGASVAVQATATGPTSAPQPTPDATQPAPIVQAQPTAEPSTAAPPDTTAAPSTAAPPDATAAPSTPVASPSYVEYTVQKGDLLYTIALKNDITIEDILAINQIANPESLTVGQIIRIPKR